MDENLDWITQLLQVYGLRSAIHCTAGLCLDYWVVVACSRITHVQVGLGVGTKGSVKWLPSLRTCY